MIMNHHISIGCLVNVQVCTSETGYGTMVQYEGTVVRYDGTVRGYSGTVRWYGAAVL